MYLEPHHPRVERWRQDLAELVHLNNRFRARPLDSPDEDWEVEMWLHTMHGESSGHWMAYNERYDDVIRRASGLFQHLPKYWEERGRKALHFWYDRGLSASWMDQEEEWRTHWERDLMPNGRPYRKGIWHPQLNMAAAVMLREGRYTGTRESGWEAWSTTHTKYRPDLYQTPTEDGGTYYVRKGLHSGKYVNVTLADIR